MHCIATGGGLSDDQKCISTRKDFLFPVRVLSALFRGKLLDWFDEPAQMIYGRTPVSRNVLVRVVFQSA